MKTIFYICFAFLLSFMVGCRVQEPVRNITSESKVAAYVWGSGTLWCYDKDNFMFVNSDDKVTWWGNENEWKEKPNDDSYLVPDNSPRNVTKAPIPNPPGFFTKEEREKIYNKIHNKTDVSNPSSPDR